MAQGWTVVAWRCSGEWRFGCVCGSVCGGGVWEEGDSVSVCGGRVGWSVCGGGVWEECDSVSVCGGRVGWRMCV